MSEVDLQQTAGAALDGAVAGPVGGSAGRLADKGLVTLHKAGGTTGDKKADALLNVVAPHLGTASAAAVGAGTQYNSENQAPPQTNEEGEFR
ncbi:hypothetical protein ACFFUB_11015 [Algimonas porphyrae]|uniref:hypothetical protein n=1 Tax=Algimonas porphyrae TaxID=1128113 RepID=UPI0024E0F223|nr:hypothetical protein [Algimonas porphyrae]